MDPNPSQSHLRHQQQEKQTSEQQVTNDARAEREFESVEELLRFDAGQTKPPAAVAERLRESLNAEPTPKRSWWQRFFGTRGGK